MYDLLDEQDDFLIVNKHSGVCVHSEPGLIGLLVALKQNLKLDNLFPVHRLDKVTSGLMVIAKSTESASSLSVQFQQRQVEKYYLALSDRKPSKKQGAIIGDMERGRRGSWKLSRTCQNPAETRFFSYGLGKGKRLFIVKPTTGKTHQIRVALKSIGSPIIGDRLYGHPLGMDKSIYLHAFFLAFIHGGKKYQYCSRPENWFTADALEPKLEIALEKPQELSWPS